MKCSTFINSTRDFHKKSHNKRSFDRGNNVQGIFKYLIRGVPDQSISSEYFAYSGKKFFLRGRVEENPLAYTGGFIAGSKDPISSGQWSLIIDVNGGGWQDFAIQINGASGSPSQSPEIGGQYKT